MTGKRFEYKNHKVFDNLTGETHSSNMVSVNVLNKIYEEKQTMITEFAKTIRTYEDEIQRLKAQLLCDSDEGVCNICQHQYLIESRKYYIAKCKKEHEECSKMSLKYCEDFELEK